MDELAELRGRADANDRIVEALVTMLVSDLDEPLRRLFTADLLDWRDDPGPKMGLSDNEAVAWADRLVMMRSAMAERVARLADILGTTALLDPPEARPGSSR